MRRLVDSIAFDPARDKLWFVGDLVNRGPSSLECLRFVKSLGDSALVVLGNHDLHLLSVAEGLKSPGRRDTFEDILEARDRDELLDWIRTRPLFHAEEGFALVHAGLLPSWSVAKAAKLAREVERSLRSSAYRDLLKRMYGDSPERWSDDLEGVDRLRVIINAMTRLRVCDDEGAMVLGFKGEPGEAHEGWTPWFDIPGRKSADHVVVCGHWSALGLLARRDLISLDSGCVWGRSLTAVRLSDRRTYQVACPAKGREG